MDIYDKEVERLTNNPQDIWKDWNYTGSILFSNAAPKGVVFNKKTNEYYGCITQVKARIYPAYTRNLTDEIREDKRVPSDGKYITVEDLPVFAEYRRKIDVLALESEI